MRIEDVIKKPLVTEKASIITEKCNRYAFVVDSKSNKFQIKNAVESLYNVKVLSVKTMLGSSKKKRVGRHVATAAKVKKALVELDKGQKIEFFKGV